MLNLKNLLKPSLPKAIAATAIAGLYAMVEFRHVPPKAVPSSAVRTPPPFKRSVSRPTASSPKKTPSNNVVMKLRDPLPKKRPLRVAVVEPVEKKEIVVPKKRTRVTKKKRHLKKRRTRISRNKVAATNKVSKEFKPIQKKRVPTQPTRKDVISQLMQVALDTPLPLEKHAVNLTGPLQKIFEVAMAETPQTLLLHPDRRIASAEMAAGFWVDKQFPALPMQPVVVMSKVVQQDFSDVRETIVAAREASKELGIKKKAPKEWKPPPVESLSIVAQRKPPKPKTEPELVQVEKKVQPTLVASLGSEVKEEVQPQREKAVPETRIKAKTVEVSEPPEEVVSAIPTPEVVDQEFEVSMEEESTKNQLVREESVDSQSLAAESSQISLAGVAAMTTPPVTSQKKPTQKVVPKPQPAPAKKSLPNKSLFSRKAAVPKTRARQDKLSKNVLIEGKVGGYFRIEQSKDKNGVLAWLNKNKGLIELYMHPVGSRNPEDTIHLGRVKPGEYFEYDADRLVGKYRLYANFFKRDEIQPVNVPYRGVVSGDNYRRIEFYVSDEMFTYSRVHSKNIPSRSVVITAPIFSLISKKKNDPLTGEFRKPDTIPGAEVTVDGFEKWGKFVADANGNVRIPNLPTQSEFLLKVHAKGYQPSIKLVSTFRNSTHAPLYMFSEDRRPTLSYFLKRKLDDKKATILGRSFDPITRIPISGERFNLSFNRSGAIYFEQYKEEAAKALGLFGAWSAMHLGIIPNSALSATSALGFGGYFNVHPTFRAFGPEGKRPQFGYMHPGYLHYFEFGRGGMKTLRGRLLDPFGGKIREARVQVVGDKNFEVFTDSSNRFAIEGVSHTGQITVQVEAPGYGVTWHDISFDTRNGNKEHELFILEEDLIDESANQARVVRRRGLGTLVGGAEKSFFKGQRKCVYVQLLDHNNNLVSPEKGPFPLGKGVREEGKPMCLSRKNRGFKYFNLDVGQYKQNFVSEDGTLLRAHIRNVGKKSTTISVN